MSKTTRLATVAVAVLGFSVPGFGITSFSFTGQFVHDNDVQLFNFNLTSGGSISVRTLSYGGGVNALGQTILPGGFETLLALYAADGTAVTGPIFPGPDPSCSPRVPDPNRLNGCFDAYQSGISLAAGNYILALTQNGNAPNGNLSDGFFYSTPPNVDANFNSGFMGTFGFQGTSAWAVDITGAQSASQQFATPEPGPASLTATGIAFAAFLARRRRTVRN